MERLSFSNAAAAVDLDGNAGITAKILGAVFGQASLTNKVYVGIGLDFLDHGTSHSDLIALAVQAAGFHGNSDFVTRLYKNVVGTDVSPAELAYFVGLLDSGSETQRSLALMASESDLNKQHIDLVGLASTGIEYLPVG